VGNASGRYGVCMTSQAELARDFLELHRPGDPLMMPNAWDAGSARILTSLGFGAIATTSSGCAAAVGRADGDLVLDEALMQIESIAAATGLPVSADFEDCFGTDLAGVAANVRRAISTGLAGCSIEDYTRDKASPVYGIKEAAARVAAAAEAAHEGPVRLVLTARAENYLYGITDLADTIARLQAYQEAGADVLYAPGLRELEDIRQVVSEVGRPVNVLALGGSPTVPELAQAGVARISVGGSFAFAAYGALVNAATELRDQGTYGYRALAKVGAQACARAFGERAN
jgi:2-methylisocitrate lyase-like PEP mutase family enzyme